MKIRSIGISFGLLLLFFVPAAVADHVPHEVGGFVLGEDIASYADKVQMNSALPIRYEPYLVEVETVEDAQFKSGLITMGQCNRPGRILRIKMKYADSTAEYFEQLLNKFKDRFGDPGEWRGDPFHIVKAWKWSFTDEKGDRISLTLQHNVKDQEEKMGNSVKLTLTSQIEKEQQCYEKKASSGTQPSGPPTTKENLPPHRPNWEKCVPK